MSLQITDEEWSYLNMMEVLLSKFDRATKVKNMERWNCDLWHVADAALLKLKKYEAKTSEWIISFIATVLHPALKLTYFKEHGYPSIEVREIKKIVSEYCTVNYEDSEDNVETQS